ncbi:sn-glycerol-3-phosphate ABC transporter substrate-binding protein UgpB [Jiella sp. MQZ9-1]|uniref:sn-glycerol-3-phosphate-binding periplasmic protein UgpB n=1 Tax=Jiella flava TaxID=2816857 RepID=A0A939FZ78_9HYPH|nr:sn-glycerol-3-phosphate ABC transporter substrate-binding protein UgpB [Jiella flava]MBO0662921.1 sn-glycerol-3-phosphate ABC transporter substrate-binding protein UgpB [Jiella flava]MCD2471319.1 sn-glycerol-3-phosphate ABC transporter substrate-binding protein UgpB [Jiella flava]
MNIRSLVLAGALAATTALPAFAATEIQWWHSMGGANGEKLEEIANEFNKSQSEYKIVPVNKGKYAESMTAAIAAFRAGQQPDILQVFEVGTGTFMAAKQAIYPVEQLMKDEGETFDPSVYLPAVTGYYETTKGKLLSFPFNSSTPILYYNKDAFKKAGLTTPPKTWADMASAATKIVKSGAAKCGFTTTWPSWMNVENLSAFNNVPLATEQNGMGGLDAKFVFAEKGLVPMHWANLAKWQKTGAYQYRGRTGDAVPSFTSGDCAMIIESSAGRAAILKSSKFNVGFSMMPYYASQKGAPQNSIIGGASLWVMRGKPESHYKGVAKFFTFLSQPKIQAEWHQFTGYLPITKAAYELSKKEGYYKKNPGAEIAIKEITLNKPTENSKGLRFGDYVQIRNVFQSEIEQTLNGSKTAEQAAKDAEAKGNEMLRAFQQSHE